MLERGQRISADIGWRGDDFTVFVAILFCLVFGFNCLVGVCAADPYNKNKCYKVFYSLEGLNISLCVHFFFYSRRCCL
jgi:hypothetical protein